MQEQNGQRLYSASDIVSFLDCEHSITLALRNFTDPVPKNEEDEQTALVASKGMDHERRYVSQLQAQGKSFVDVTEAGTSRVSRAERTLEAMRAGVDVIYQATFTHGDFMGYADFLVKVDKPSKFGNYSYEVEDTKLARSVRAKFIIQLAFYSWMLSWAQEVAPEMMHVVLGSGRRASYRVADYARYLQSVLSRFMARVQIDDADTYPEPCDKCSQCQWSDYCTEQRETDDHLSLVANISRVQVKKLEAHGIATLAALANLPAGRAIPKIADETLSRIQQQAALQLRARTEGKLYYEILPNKEGGIRGFERLPEPNPGDMFFDMEGNPLEEGGLEYLFGLWVFDEGRGKFVAFWAHNRQEEKLAFEQFIDYVVDRIRRYPDAYIYHYAPYESTALKKLMSVHGTRGVEVDNLLRTGKLVDLYQVVREALRLSTPNYSIKSVEHFYRGKRTGDVTNAGASIVFYERWKESQDAAILQSIADYNQDDVESTYELRQWLVAVRPGGLQWLNRLGQGELANTRTIESQNAYEARLEKYRQSLLSGLPENEDKFSDDDVFRSLTFQLLDFHRREAKPAWWDFFRRQEMTAAELVEDQECIGGMEFDETNPPTPVNRSIRYTYVYPEQETKLRNGSKAVDVATGKPLANLEIDAEKRTVSFTRGANSEAPEPRMAIGPTGPVSSTGLVEAVYRFADSVILGDSRYAAVESILQNKLPVVAGFEKGAGLVSETRPLLPQTIDVVMGMQNCVLFLQGPPGAGKTYSGSRIILSLLKAGKRVGITSNSHDAINNLLEGVAKAAVEAEFELSGVKKSTNEGQFAYVKGIADVTANDEVDLAKHQLIAGTAWLFSRAEFDQQLDYIFADEAGQISLANMVAIGTAASNIVLLGDQMQLGQPTQGVHPGRSGESTLEYLLNGAATIAPERGIFLSKTFRMHPDVCSFISDAVYEGRLEADESAYGQRLVLKPDAHLALAPTGLQYVPVEHDGCAQASPQEVATIVELVDSLLEQQYVGKDRRECAMTLNDILVVAPYNVQVNELRQALPEGARVGTVDKFQGQEAQVVIMSMTTSNGDYVPRDLEFLFSKNRLNVAISRAKSLAILVACPDLMSIRCKTPEQMALVNTLCWAVEYAAGAS